MKINKKQENILEKPLDLAVLFLVFNRLDVTKQVFEVIKKVKPPMLYIASDGARENVDGEFEKVESVRNFIISNIDWNCEVKTLFRDKNLGCKYAVSGAIDWFFNQEEMGIILEDDCLPSQSFFWFCEELLEKYENDMKIWHISGDNFQDGIKRGDGDYYYSKYNHIWGWATWANRWKYYDREISGFKEEKVVDKCCDNVRLQKYWNDCFNGIYNGKINTWDYQWTYTMWKNNGYAVLPNINLIKNIGFGSNATNTTNIHDQNANLTYSDIEFPLKHPKIQKIDIDADRYTDNKMFCKKFSLKRIMIKLKQILDLLLRNLKVHR